MTVSPMDTPRPLHEWMTRTEVCETLRVTRSTLNRYIAKGRIQQYGIPGTLVRRYKRVEIEAMLAPTQPDTAVEQATEVDR